MLFTARAYRSFHATFWSSDMNWPISARAPHVAPQDGVGYRVAIHRTVPNFTCASDSLAAPHPHMALPRPRPNTKGTLEHHSNVSFLIAQPLPRAWAASLFSDFPRCHSQRPR